MKYTLTHLLVTIMTYAGAQDSDEWAMSYENFTEYVYGFIHIKDTALSIPAEYGEAHAFSEGLAAVKKDGKWGFIDADNQPVIDFKYDYARSFRQGQAIVQQGDFYGVINNRGALVIPVHYYDLIPYELEGTRYYISRDSTFFQGIIDTAGNEILPHRYAFVIPFEPNLSKRRFYGNIPFYTTYWEIDTAKGSFYKQFSEVYYELSSDSSRQDIYDAQFNRLASKNTTSYSDQFTHDELINIDDYLEDHKEVDIERQRVAIRRLLDSQKAYTPKPRSAREIVPASEEGQNEYMERMGYEKFRGKDGLMGVKKDGKTILRAEFEVLKWWGMVFSSSSKASMPYLEEHYAGEYIDEEKGVFAVYGIAAGSKEKGVLYSMKGEQVFNLENGMVPEKAASNGFTYRNIKRDTAQHRAVHTFGFVDWKGQEVLPPVYTSINVLKERRLLAKREKESAAGREAHVGLYHASGAAIIPEGVFSNIEPFDEVPDLYLAEWHDTYPTLAERKAAEMANKQFVLLRVENNTYTIINRFTASVVYHRGLAHETGLLKYRVGI